MLLSISFDRTILLNGSETFSSFVLTIKVLESGKYPPVFDLTWRYINFPEMLFHSSLMSFRCLVIIETTASSWMSFRFGITDLNSMSLLSNLKLSFLNSLTHDCLLGSVSSSRYALDTKRAFSSYFLTNDSIPSFWYASEIYKKDPIRSAFRSPSAMNFTFTNASKLSISFIFVFTYRQKSMFWLMSATLRVKKILPKTLSNTGLRVKDLKSNSCNVFSLNPVE